MSAAAEEEKASKEAALEACAERHLKLIKCYRECNFWSTLTGGCCSEENKAFWDCYVEARGKNETLLTSWLRSPVINKDKPQPEGQADSPAD